LVAARLMRLVVEDLAGARGGRTLFEALGFALSPGDALVVTGPNGSGKSTLLRILAGLLPPQRGGVRMEGAEDGDAGAASHYLGGRTGMKPALTLAENLGFWRDFLGADGLAAGDALDRVGLGAIGDLPFGVLSTGQRQRAALARLLVARRPVWLLDEPSSGLDAAGDALLGRLMREHLAGGGMLVAATHQALGLEGALRLQMGVFGHG
jgi:heme exporter protein A